MNERDEGSGGDLIINVNLEDKDADDDNATQRSRHARRILRL